MSMAGPAITFSEKETQVFSQVFKKLQSKEWTPAKAAAYFKNDQKTWARFTCFSAGMVKNAEAELEQKRAEYAQREIESQAIIKQEKENIAQSQARVAQSQARIAESQARVAQSQARIEQIDAQKAVIFNQIRKTEEELGQARSQAATQILGTSSRITVK